MDQQAKLEKDKAQIEQKMNQARRARDMSSSIMENALKRYKDDAKRMEVSINSCEKQINDTNFKLSTKETQMLQTLRELCTWDIFAPEDYFKGDKVVQKSKMVELLEEATEKDIVRPMDNFWKPLNYEHEYLVKPNSVQA